MDNESARRLSVNSETQYFNLESEYAGNEQTNFRSILWIKEFRPKPQDNREKNSRRKVGAGNDFIHPDSKTDNFSCTAAL